MKSLKKMNIGKQFAMMGLPFVVLILTLEVCHGQDDIYNTVAQETCDCITKQKTAKQTKEQVEAALGICMLESISKNKVNVETTDGDAMRAFGQKVGAKMAPICPSVFKVFLGDSDDKSENANEEKSVAVEGKIKGIETDGLLYLIVKEDSGNEQRIVWLSYFEGSDGFVTEPKKLVGKNVSLKYRTIQYYVPKAKGYLSLKEVVALKLKD